MKFDEETLTIYRGRAAHWLNVRKAQIRFMNRHLKTAYIYGAANFVGQMLITLALTSSFSFITVGLGIVGAAIVVFTFIDIFTVQRNWEREQ
jgi:hypothetical protein